MSFPKDEIVVTDIAGECARVHTTSSMHTSALIGFGFVEKRDSLEFPLRDEKDRVRVIKMLIRLAALFSAGRDWSPEALVEHYREKGLISGPYRVITWKSPEDYVVSNR